MGPPRAGSACAPPWGKWTSRRSLASTAAAGIAGRPASRPISATRSSSTSSVPRSEPSSDAPAAGVLLIDKPAGVTSHDVVERVRRERGQRTGHAGTLDPFATGLLIVLVARAATRKQGLFMRLAKTYRA